MNREQFAARMKAASSSSRGTTSHAKARSWYSITCPVCGRDTWGSSTGAGQLGVRLTEGQKRFRCKCGRSIDLRCSRGS